MNNTRPGGNEGRKRGNTMCKLELGLYEDVIKLCDWYPYDDCDDSDYVDWDDSDFVDSNDYVDFDII